MKNKIIYLFTALLLVMGVSMHSCTNTTEALEVQKPYEYSDQYYADLRAYKESDHAVTFVWFADYTATHSYGLHFKGLPDSIDICSLWGGIPSGKILEEMRFVQKVKGTKMVLVTFAQFEGSWEYLMDIPLVNGNERNIAFADSLLKKMWQYDLDGIDLDYEPTVGGGSNWVGGQDFVNLITYLGQHIGPKSKNPEKLLIVDGEVPIGGYEYISYFVAQAYHSYGAQDLQYRFNSAERYGLVPEKYIVTENTGDYYQNGGVPFTEADGNTISADGGRLHSLEGMARWNPTQGRKGGFGSFYVQRDYNSNPPYKYLRMGIQQQNPAEK